MSEKRAGKLLRRAKRKAKKPRAVVRLPPPPIRPPEPTDPRSVGFHKGRQAAQRGEPIDSCPYRRNGEWRDVWLIGWRTAGRQIGRPRAFWGSVIRALAGLNEAR